MEGILNTVGGVGGLGGGMAVEGADAEGGEMDV